VSCLSEKRTQETGRKMRSTTRGLQNAERLEMCRKLTRASDHASLSLRVLYGDGHTFSFSEVFPSVPARPSGRSAFDRRQSYSEECKRLENGVSYE
jgi:hypothetical protein